MNWNGKKYKGGIFSVIDFVTDPVVITCFFVFGFVIAGSVFYMGGCTDAGRKNLTTIGSEFEVKLYSGGTVVETHVSSGKVQTETQSDGYIFVDKATGKFIRLSGTISIVEK